MENYQLAVVEATSFESQTNSELMGVDATLMQFFVTLLQNILEKGQQAQQTEISFMQDSFEAYNGDSDNPNGSHWVTDPNTGKSYKLTGDGAQTMLNSLTTEANSYLSLYQQETSEYTQGNKATFGDIQKAMGSEAKSTATIMQLGNTTAQGLAYTASLITSGA